MNSNKFDFYKNSLYFLIANGIVSLVGIILMIALGFNLDASIQSSNLLFSSVLSILVSLVIIFAYAWLRYNFVKAITIGLVVVHNVILSTALICILRISVTESLIMGYILLTGLTTFFILLCTEKLNGVKFNKKSYNEVISSTLKQSLKQVIITSAIVAAVLLLGLIVSSASMFGLVRVFAVMLIVILYSYVFVQLPIWCFFASKVRPSTKAKVDSNVQNQKVVQAVAVEETVEQSEAENEAEQNQ